MRYKILYILFFIAALLYGNYRIFWGITPRNVMTIVMMVVCIIEDRRFFLDKWFGIYLFFLLFFAMSSMLTGYLSQFLHRLIGFFLVGYVGYWSTKILVKKYEAVRLVLSLFLIIGLLDIVVTIGQFYNVPFFTVIPQLMGISVDAEFLDDLNTGEEALGVVLPGIMATDVYNGYFLMVIGVLSFCFLRSGFRIIALLPWLLTMVASFMVQQRAPFYILIFVSAFVIIKVVLLGKSRFKWLFVLLLLVLIPIGVEHLYDFLISGDSRYSIGLEATGRNDIYRQSIDFIDENILWGGFLKSGIAPHNMFLAAWMAGGIFGFIAMVVLTVMQLVSVIRLSMKRIDKVFFVYLLFGLAFVAFTMNSMFHNAGMVSGDFVLWTLWAVFLEYKNHDGITDIVPVE